MKKPKPIGNINDLLIIFQYYWVLDTNIFAYKWQRIELVLILLMAAFIVICPGALFERIYVKNSNKVFCYKDI